MMKKIISLMLVALIAFSAISAFAAPVPERADTSISDLDFMKTLGAFPNDLISGEALTRSELAKIYFRIILPSQADAEYVDYASAFSDVEGTDFAANFVASLGIMNGVGNGLFNPTGTLSYAEVAKTIVTFLGYKAHAEENGGYPNGYLYYASRFGLDKYAPSSSKAIVTNDIAAAMFRQALNTGMAEVIYEADGAVYTNKEGKNYAETYMNTYCKEGVVTATYIENMNETGAKEEYYGVKIDGEKYRLSKDTRSLNDMLGYRVEAFYTEKAGDVKEIILYSVVSTEVTTITSDDFAEADIDNNKLYYYNEKGKKKAVDISNAYVLYNGELCESYGEEVLNPFADTTCDAEIMCIDNDCDGRVDVVSVEAYKNYVVSKIVDGRIYNKYLTKTIFDIRDIEDGDIPVKNVIGNTIPLSVLDEKDVISVFTTIDGDISKIIVSIDSYVGEIKRIVNNRTTPSIQIDDVTYECAASLTDPLNKQFPKIELGNTVKVYFNFAGKISDIEVDAYSTEKIGYLVDAGVTKKPLDDSVVVKILGGNGKMFVASLDDEIMLNGEKKKAQLALGAIGFNDDGTASKRQPIKYKYDEEKNIITELTLVDESINEYSDGFYQYKNLTPDDIDYYRSATRNFGGKLLLSGSTKVFLVPNESGRYADDNYSLTDASFFPDGDQDGVPTFTAYGSDAYCPVAEILVVQTTPTDFYSLNDVLVVKSCTTVLENDAEMYMVNGYVSGREVNYLAEMDAFSQMPKCGDVMRIALNLNKHITRIEDVFSSATKQFGSSFTTNPTHSDFFRNIRYIYGSVEYQDDSVFTLKANDITNPDASIKESQLLTGYAVYEYKAEGRAVPELNLVDSSVIQDRHTNGVASNVFIFMRSGTPNFIIVYN